MDPRQPRVEPGGGALVTRTPVRGPGRHRGLGIRGRLLALILIPLLGATFFSNQNANNLRLARTSAERISNQIALISRLDAARQANYMEGLQTSFDFGPTAHLSLPPAVSRKFPKSFFSTDNALYRSITDTAVKRLGQLPGGAAPAQSLKLGLVTARHLIDQLHPDLRATSLAYLQLGIKLAADENNALRNIAIQPVAERSGRALLASVDQLRQIAAVALAGEQEDTDFLSIMTFFGHPQAELSRQALIVASGAFTTDAADLASHLSPTLRRAWLSFESSSEHTTFTAAAQAIIIKGMSASPIATYRRLAAVSGAGPPSPQVAHVLLRIVESGAASISSGSKLNDLLHSAILEAAGIARSDQAAAKNDDGKNLFVGGLFLLASILAGAAVSISISRPLRRLAASGQRISDGDLELVGVPISGPHEVRVVARALDATLGNLRTIQTQAEAIASGNLDPEMIVPSLPGPFGRLLRSSVERMFATMRDREELETRLVFQAGHDQLTGLPNRASTEQLLEAALARASRGGYSVGLLFVDLDDFKPVNDTLGHGAGNEVLCSAAARMRSNVRTGDIVCRLGSDEFAVVVEPLGPDRGLVDQAQRIIEAIARPMSISGRQIKVGASVGIVVSQDGETDGGKLLSEAEAAVYRAKAAGRGVVELFDEGLRREMRDTIELQEAIIYGLAHDEFVLFYQPVVDTSTGHPHGFEALIRWVRPGFGLVPPDEFIPVAEASHVIIDIGRWVLQTATAQLVAWGEIPALAQVDMAVNISGRHLLHPSVVDDVRGALDSSGIDPSRLIVEITETVVVDDLAAINHMSALKDLGVRIALDDFGTGYTSISQLHRLPVDILKIDRSFISSPEGGRRQIVELIVEIAHTLGLGVIAEGVEELPQLEHLQSVLCEDAQGYMFAKPLPVDAVVDWCAAQLDRGWQTLRLANTE